jgi:hypothetical protein
MEEEEEDDDVVEDNKHDESGSTKLTHSMNEHRSLASNMCETLNISQPEVSSTLPRSVETHDSKLVTDQLSTNKGKANAIHLATRRHGIQSALESNSPTESPRQPSFHTDPQKESTRQPSLTSPCTVAAEPPPPPPSVAVLTCEQTPQTAPVVSEENVTPPLRDISQNNNQEILDASKKREFLPKKLSSALWTVANNKLFDILDDDDGGGGDDDDDDVMEEKKAAEQVQSMLFISQSKNMATEPGFHDDNCILTTKTPSGSLFHSSTLAGFDPDDFSEDDE